MRDPARIDRIIEKLWALWKTQPDLRLGQLLVNVIRPSQPCPQVFYVEDTTTEKKLDGYPDANAERYVENEVTLSLSRAEAVVLFELVTRFSDTDKLTVEHPAEARILWDVCCLLERQLGPDPRDPDWARLLAEARERVQPPSNE
jgi:hypothetical protein